MKKVCLLFGLMLFLVMAGCVTVQDIKDSTVDLAELETKAQIAMVNHSPEEIQQNIRKLAPYFAKVIQNDHALRQLLGLEIGKKFDGDFEVLYDIIATKMSNNGTSLHHSLRSQVKDTDFEKLVNSIPYFNISIPVNYEKWGTYTGPIYVIPMDYSVDDTELTTLPGYDAEGNVKMFDMDTPPDYPVIVLGINERIDFLKHKQKEEEFQFTTQAGVNHDELLYGIYLVDDKEPWVKGSPEVYGLYAVGYEEQRIYQPYSSVDEEGKWYNFGGALIFSYDDSTHHMYWKMRLKESDWDMGSYINFTVSGGFTWENQYFPIQATFKIDESIVRDTDDDYGETQVYFYHQKNQYGYTQYYLGDAYMRFGYIEY